MKIVVYTESYLPNLGGLERNTRMLCRLLSKAANVVLLTPVKQKAPERDREPFIIIRSSSPLVYAKQIKYCDLFIANGGVALKPLTWVLLWNKPFWLIYQMASLFLLGNTPTFKQKLSCSFRKYAAGKARLNVAVSEYSKLELQRLLPKNQCEVLINPVDKELEQYIQPFLLEKVTIKPFRLLFAGRLTEGKGIFILIQAVKEVLSTHPDLFELHIAGSGDAEIKVKQYIVGDKSFIFHGRIDQEELIRLYQFCHLTIIPSYTHTEGSPLTMAESIYCGTPVLVSDQPAMISSMGNAGFSFESGNKEALKVSLLEYAMNRSFRKMLIENVRNHKEYFSSSNYKKKLTQLLNQEL